MSHKTKDPPFNSTVQTVLNCVQYERMDCGGFQKWSLVSHKTIKDDSSQLLLKAEARRVFISHYSQSCK